MQINALSKQIALKNLLRESGAVPGEGMTYRQLQRLWHRTGLRRSDLDDALNESLYRGDLAEQYTAEGRVAVLTDKALQEKRSNAEPLHLKEAYRSALAALEWARVRSVSSTRGSNNSARFGRRRADI